MKKILYLILFITLAFSMFAAGSQEDSGPLVLGIQNGDYEASFAEDGEDIGEHSGVWYFRDIVLKDFPYEVEIRSYAQDSSTIKLDADIAGGDPPDVYYDYLGRVNKYANSKYAVALDRGDYEDEFIPSYLDQLTKDHVLYGLPETAWAAVMIINKTLVESAGAGNYLPADDDPDRSWTVSDFLSVVDAVQDKYGPDYYGYVLFAAGTGGDYWSSFGWLAGAGAKLYENGKIVIGQHEGLKALTFMNSMLEDGYVMPGAAGLAYGDNLSAMSRNDTVAMGASINQGFKAIDLSDGTGTIDTVIMEYPHFPGVTQVPLTVGPNAGMIFNKGNPTRIEKSKELLEWITSERVQTYQALVKIRFASRKGVPAERQESLAWSTVNNMIAKSGVFDGGIGLEHYAEIREMWPPCLQSIFSGELTVKEAVDRFVSEGNKILE